MLGNQRPCKKVPKVYLLSAQAFYATFGIPISCMYGDRYKATALLDGVYRYWSRRLKLKASTRCWAEYYIGKLLCVAYRHGDEQNVA